MQILVTRSGVELHWRGNHISETVDRDVSVSIPFHYGMPFYFLSSFILDANAGSATAPSVGFAEADFLDGGTFAGGIVFDSVGTALSDPIVDSDSGFDYVTAPEPETSVLSIGSMTAILLAEHRKNKRRFWARCPSNASSRHAGVTGCGDARRRRRASARPMWRAPCECGRKLLQRPTWRGRRPSTQLR